MFVLFFGMIFTIIGFVLEAEERRRNLIEEAARSVEDNVEGQNEAITEEPDGPVAKRRRKH